MNKKGMDPVMTFILVTVLLLIVVAVFAVWLYFGEGGGLKGKLSTFITENIVRKLGGG